MRRLEFDLADEEETQRLGAALAGALRRGDAVCLHGPLGAGKTTLARGLVRALTSAEEDVPSPTFTLVQTYRGPDFPLAHFDLYRLERSDEVFELGLDEALEDGVAVIEWPERLGGRLSPDRLDIEIGFRGEGRFAVLTPHGAWKVRPIEF